MAQNPHCHSYVELLPCSSVKPRGRLGRKSQREEEEEVDEDEDTTLSIRTGQKEMSELRDAAIKLFGKTITVQCGGDEETALQSKIFERKRMLLNHRTRRKLTSANRRGHRRPKNDQVMQGFGRRRQRGSRRRSFLVLGAEAPDTKFCYYNNYNANQPRHFCRNCQRYWTAGGAMRNVLVGAGRRKTRSTSHDRHVVLRFGSDAAGNNGDEQSSKESDGTSSFPVAFYPVVAQWSCTVPPGAWSTPRLSPVASSSPESSSPTIRKRSRMDDLEEPARSSVLKAFQRKVDVEDHGMEAPLLLHANLVALSRSLSFQERSKRSAAVGERRNVSADVADGMVSLHLDYERKEDISRKE